MSTQTTHNPATQTVVSLSLRKLVPHPANPNRMSDAAFKKLVKHIERTSQYEPIVVRVHPHRKGAWQILNGHHRLRALTRLNYSHADCVVFNADDAEAMVYLATLNQLTGRDTCVRNAGSLNNSVNVMRARSCRGCCRIARLPSKN